MTFYKLVRNSSVLLFKILFRLRVKGAQNIPRRGGFIMAANHASYMDPLIVGYALFRELDFMARHDLFKNPFFGALIRSLNAFPVKRGGHDTDAIAVAIDRVRRGRSLLIFPEGTRSITGELGPARKGISYLAEVTGADVVPCYIRGSNRVLGVGSRRIRFEPVSVYFGKPLRYAKGQGYKEFAESVMREISLLKEKSDAD